MELEQIKLELNNVIEKYRGSNEFVGEIRRDDMASDCLQVIETMERRIKKLEASLSFEQNQANMWREKASELEHKNYPEHFESDGVDKAAAHKIDWVGADVLPTRQGWYFVLMDDGKVGMRCSLDEVLKLIAGESYWHYDYSTGDFWRTSGCLQEVGVRRRHRFTGIVYSRFVIWLLKNGSRRMSIPMIMVTVLWTGSGLVLVASRYPGPGMQPGLDMVTGPDMGRKSHIEVIQDMVMAQVPVRLTSQVMGAALLGIIRKQIRAV